MGEIGRSTLWLVLISLLMTLEAPASGGRLYIYRDARGVLHFTNVAPPSRAVGAGWRAPGTGPSGREKLRAYVGKIEEVARRYGLDPALVEAIIIAESGAEPRAVSKKGAMGLMQIMPTTAMELGVSNPFNPHANIEGGVRYLRQLLDRFQGNLLLALAGYNAGPAAVERYGGVPPYRETRRYVRRVLLLWKALRQTERPS